MICRTCRKDLNFPDAVLKQLSTCPYCNAPFKMDPKNIEEAFTWFLEDNGIDILAKENEARFEKMLKVHETSKFPDANKLELLRALGILQRIYNVREASDEEKVAELQACFKYMTDLHVEIPFAKGALDLLQNAMKMTVDFSPNTFIDPRDGNTYKTVKIGNKVWMAENLRYRTHTSFVYNGDQQNEKTYGRLYTYDNAMVACPKGWHLPTINEMNELIAAAGNSAYALQAKNVKGWPKALDELGFSALPAGIKLDSRNIGLGHIAVFLLPDKGYVAYLDKDVLEISLTSSIFTKIPLASFAESSVDFSFLKFPLTNPQKLYFSVRCVKDA